MPPSDDVVITMLEGGEAERMALNTTLAIRVTQRSGALIEPCKELEHFSDSVSHELYAPLRQMKAFSAFVLKDNEDALDATSVDFLKRIGARSDGMKLLIDDLLKLSRVSRQEMNRRNLDLSALATEVAGTLIQVSPAERAARLSIEPGMTTNGDSGLVRIVLENLIGNALKFTGRAVEPVIEVGHEVHDGKTVHYVRDNGAGFDMKYANKLFTPLQRLHPERLFQGAGIGLSIVQRIVIRHGGRIWAKAKVGCGATFYFTFWKTDDQSQIGLVVE